MPPTATATPVLPTATPPQATQTPLPGVLVGIATYYWDGLTGNRLGCNGYDEDGEPVIWVYDPLDVTIIAVGPDHYEDWPCGTILEVCGSGGCIVGERKDSCPGCAINHLDLSRLGHLLVCGEESGVCEVTIRRLN